MNGALDEWLSHRSAKPSTAVRIRQAPHLRKISTTPADIFLFSSQQVFRLSGRLGTPALDGVLAGVLAGVLLKHGLDGLDRFRCVVRSGPAAYCPPGRCLLDGREDQGRCPRLLKVVPGNLVQMRAEWSVLRLCRVQPRFNEVKALP